MTSRKNKYAGRPMKEAHVSLNISGKEWVQMTKIFVSVLDKFKVPKPEQAELLEILDSTKADIVSRPNE